MRLGELARHARRAGWRRVGCIARSSIDIDARPELVFALAHDVERWADLLPHYVRSRARARDACGGRPLVDFIARRPLVPALGLGLPVAWRSRTWNEPDDAAACGSCTWPARPAGWPSPGASSRADARARAA